MRLLALAGVAAAVSAVLGGCGLPAAADHPAEPGGAVVRTTARAATVASPPVDATFDYQLGGAYPPAAAVTVIERDRLAAAVSGRYTICYVNAFQTQPDEAAWWKARHAGLLLKVRGSYVEDPDWRGELLLDTSTAAKRAGIAGVVGAWVDGCAAKGFRAVEPDNLDSWTRSRGQLTQADNLAMARLLTTHAHARGLAVAQKNTAELGSTGRTKVGFDFAVAEECQVYAECTAYTGPYGRHVIEIEYTDNGPSAFAAACRARGRTTSVILRDRDVVPRGSDGYRYRSC